MSDDDVATYVRPHLVLDEDCWYSCSQGDTCDDTRAGMPCDCGADRTNAVLAALRSQNQALQEALRRIAETPDYDLNAASEPSARAMADIARSALSPTQETDPE